MHELGLCTSIVDAVGKRAGERPVARVTVRVGRLHHVHREAFDQSFAMAAMGTVAEDATAELIMVPVRAYCSSCGERFESDDLPAACGSCGAVDVEIVGGDELVLESLEYRS
ncbi:MAG: hydrogenase maturation nickel metallochaperone HypA [Acidimicrobiales bacterium]